MLSGANLELGELDVKHHNSREIKKDEIEQKIKKQRALSGIQKLLTVSEKFSAYCDQKISAALQETEEDRVQSMMDKKSNSRVSKRGIIKELQYFTGELRDYQVDGLIWLITLFEHGVSGILADEMGLGKTIQVIALISHLIGKQINGPFLIVVPLSTLSNWRNEFKRFAPDIPVVTFYGDQSTRDRLKHKVLKVYATKGQDVRPVVLTTPHTLHAEINLLTKIRWKYVILDEGHSIKNFRTRLAQEMRMLNSLNKLLLTGTPLQNNLEELWSLLNFIMPTIFKDVDTFSSLLLLEDLQDNEKIVQEEQSNNLISSLHRLLAPFMLRRLKSEVLSDIPLKKEVLVYCPLTKLQRTLYKQVLEKHIDILRGNNTHPIVAEIDISQPRKKRKCTERKINYDFDNSNFLELDDTACSSEINSTSDQVEDSLDEFIRSTIKMSNPTVLFKKIVDHPYLVHMPLKADKSSIVVDERLMTASGKMLVLDSLLEKLQQRGHKVLLFSTFVIMLDLIEDYVLMRNYNYCRLDGSHKLEVREKEIEEFNTNPEKFIFLISTRAGGLGLNLTAADTVIFFDRDWNPQVDIQAQDRCHRIGQTKPVMVYSLITKNTIDEKIVSVGTSKRRLEKIVIKDGKFKNVGNRAVNVLDLEELQQMLEADTSETIFTGNGNIYSNAEINTLLDRSELYKQMKKKAKVQRQGKLSI